MKFLFDFFPVLLFFIAYKAFDIYTATLVAIASSFIQVVWFRLAHGRYENSHLITLGLIVVLGGATLYLQDEMFIKWKPTVVNWLFAAVFLGSQFIGKKTLVERFFGNVFTLSAPLWQRLNTSWILFFVILGLINLYVVYNFDTDTWVNFKLFGMFGLTFAFIIIQSLLLGKYMKLPESDNKE